MSDQYDGPAMAQQILKLQAEVAHWKANHASEVQRARILKERPDIPIERVQAYEQWGKDQADAERYRHLCERVPDPAWLNNCIDAAREVKP